MWERQEKEPASKPATAASALPALVGLGLMSKNAADWAADGEAGETEVGT